MNCKVSIIIPTYNRSKLLLETLCSVRDQTLKNWECIIVDDGSNDNYSNVIDFISRDRRFQYHKRPPTYPKGASACRNYGFELSKGDYIQWLDDDDLLSENKLELQVRKLDALNNSNIFTLCDWDLLWPGKNLELKNCMDDKEFLDPQDFFKRLVILKTFIPPLSYLTPRNLINKAGLWNIHLTLNDDAEFFTRILVQSQKLVNTTGCFVLYREHGGERLSKLKSNQGLNSLLLSLKLMNSYLKLNNFHSISYFKWKLLLCFHQYWKTHKGILKKDHYFFKEHDINLNWANYYLLKKIIYKKFYPFYKNRLKKIKF